MSDHEYEMFNTKNKLIKDTVKLIQNNWQSKYFELIVAKILGSISNIESSRIGILERAGTYFLQ